MNIKPHLINFLKWLNCILASSEKVDKYDGIDKTTHTMHHAAYKNVSIRQHAEA